MEVQIDFPNENFIWRRLPSALSLIVVFLALFADCLSIFALNIVTWKRRKEFAFVSVCFPLDSSLPLRRNRFGAALPLNELNMHSRREAELRQGMLLKQKHKRNMLKHAIRHYLIILQNIYYNEWSRFVMSLRELAALPFTKF